MWERIVDGRMGGRERLAEGRMRGSKGLLKRG
jgi:hypothetical protein